MVRDRSRDSNVLLDDEDGKVLLVGETDQEIPHLGHDHRREAFGWLVHDKKPRIAEQRPRDRQHLLFAARQLAATVRAPLGQTWKNRIDPLDRPVAPGSCAEPQCLVDRKTRPQTPPLGYVAHASACDRMRLESDEIAPLETDRPG